MDNKDTKIGIIGTGYVGLVTGVCFADLGYPVSCLDIEKEKVDMINDANPPIYEKGLKELLIKVVKEENLLSATLERKYTVENSDIIFICLPTPSDDEGKIDLTYIKNEVREIGKVMKGLDDYKTIVIKSTVIPGTTNGIVKDQLEQYSGKKAGMDFGLAMNPEFLMEGLAIENFTDPDRIVIGGINGKSIQEVKKLYVDFDCEIVETSLSGAEMIKYASNSFLATKISFINEIANMCEILDIDVGEVANGIGLDNRISPKFLRAGVGFGGSCFPKDVKALNSLSKEIGRPSNILEATINTNEQQPIRAVQLLEQEINLENRLIGLLGLAFKPDTDDMREAPSIKISQILREKGATIKGYDPIAKDTAQKAIPFIDHKNSIEEVIEDSDAVILVTEWEEIKNLTPQNFNKMKGNIIIDGRRVLNPSDFTKQGYRIKVIGNGSY